MGQSVQKQVATCLIRRHPPKSPKPTSLQLLLPELLKELQVGVKLVIAGQLPDVVSSQGSSVASADKFPHPRKGEYREYSRGFFGTLVELITHWDDLKSEASKG